MVSGSDCFGTPITIEADKRGLPPKEIVNEYHKKDVELFKKISISYDLYTRTDTPNHKKVTQEIFLKLLEKGLIFKDITKQYYSPSEKKFLPDRYVEGTCPHCESQKIRSDQCENCGAILEQGELKDPKSRTAGAKVELRETEHYFLDWPKLSPFLTEYLKSKKRLWRDWVYKETEGWLKKGLKPRAITRDLDWGIELPIEKIPKNLRIENIEHKRIYVWFDAVIGYLSASIEWAENQHKPEKWKEWWYNEDSEHYYFMGKDNLVFHALFWPGQLYSYDHKIHLPDFPAINQFLNIYDQKFSKSKGIVIDSKYITENYGTDPVRFYLLTIMPENHDANFTWPDFVSTTNDILIGSIGNFVHRALVLASRANLNPDLIQSKTEIATEKLVALALDALKNCSFKKYSGIVQELADFGNKYLSQNKPWALVENDAEFNRILSNAAYIVLSIQVLLKPILPETYDKLATNTGIDFKFWPESKEIKNNLIGLKIQNPKILFSKIDPEIIELESSKIQLNNP